MVITIVDFTVGGHTAITTAGAITMPRSWWSRRAAITTTIDCFRRYEKKNPAAQVGFFIFVEFRFQQFESAVGSKDHLLGQ
jgi:hypothetical protein